MPHSNFRQNAFAIELIYRPAIPNNCDNWQVFNDDNHIKEFLVMGDNFKELFFEGSSFTHREAVIEVSNASKTVEDKESLEEPDSSIIQWKGNKIPKGLVSLENIFDKHDRYIQNQRNSSERTSAEYQQINIETVNKPRLVNLATCCTIEESERFISLFKQYQDVFA